MDTLFYSSSLHKISLPINSFSRQFNIPSGYTVDSPVSFEHPDDILEGSLCLFASQFQGGLRLPLHPVIVYFYNARGVSPSQLTPNSFRYFSSFITTCCLLGEELHPRAFLRMYRLSKNKDCSFYVFSSSEGRTFMVLSNCFGWKDSYFLFGSLTPWECQTHFVSTAPKPSSLPEVDDTAKRIIKKICSVENPHPWKYPAG